MTSYQSTVQLSRMWTRNFIPLKSLHNNKIMAFFLIRLAKLRKVVSCVLYPDPGFLLNIYPDPGFLPNPDPRCL